MKDARLEAIARAAEELQRGHFDVELPRGEGDAIDRVAGALESLSRDLARHFRELQAMVAVTERVNAGLLLDEVCDHVYDSFHDLLPYDRLGLALLEEEGTVLRARWARSESDKICLSQGYAANMAGSSLERILRTGKPRVLNDLEAYLHSHPESESTALMVEEGVRSSLTCPLVAEGRQVGFLFFSSFQAGTYAREHVELYQAIAGQLSVIVEKSRLYQELVELHQFKNRMLGVAAHDLRNPLMLVMTSMELLSLGIGGELSDRGQELVGRAQTAAERMVRLIEDLLDVSAIEAGHLRLVPDEIELGTWLARRVDDQRLLAERKGIQLQLSVPDHPVVARVDPDRVEQVFTNLLSNAVKYSEPDSLVEVRLLHTGPHAVLEVQDHGQGIPASELERVFVPFARTSATPTAGESSTGLGMAICRKIVEAHGGSIEVESTVGQGTCVRMELPASP